MLKTIKGFYTMGRIEPAEPLPLEEGAEVEVTIALPEAPSLSADPTGSTSGAWGSLLDCGTFEEDVYRSRLLNTRPEVTL
ncbi:MAG TPA: hypothetical protein VFJ58_19910 [Armatimonadota bacterium]|nr:hypothetical protein [Armatimonadota bacterium]